MNMDNIGKERKLVAATFLFLFGTFAVMGLFMENTVEVSRYGEDRVAFDGDLPIGYYELDSTSTNEKKLKAIVKGSIYEEGDNMTVYGACFDGDGYLLPEAVAEFTAWYPNGTIMVGPNATMDKIYDGFEGFLANGTGRWKIHVTMGDTVGTYLTEMRCIYEDEWAVAFGEWQNPAWVVRIATINNITESIQTDLASFQFNTTNNFQDILDAINDGAGTNDAIRELGDQLTALHANLWTLDETNPFFVLASGEHNFVAVDMLNPDAVGVASNDGYFVYWDGETWNEVNSSNEYRGIALLPSNTIYAYVVGTDGVNPIYTVNGANATTPTLPSGSPTAFNDVTLFQQPNNPSGDYYIYLVGDDGTVYYSNNSGANYTDVGSVGAADKGRFSEVVENYDTFAQYDGYTVLVGQGSTLLSHDGNSSNTFGVSGTIKDVSLLYYNLGYVVVEDTSDTKIYKWNGTGVELEYTIEDASIVPTGVEILTQNDVWVTTTDPSTFYHFDGRRWQYSTVGYSEAVSVVISFNGGGNTTTQGLQDVVLTDSRHGYAVGQDGVILVFESEVSSQLQAVLEAVNAIDINFTPVLEAINASELNLQITLDAINSSLHLELTDIDNTLASINQSMELNFADVDTQLAQINLTANEIQSVLEGNMTIINQKLDEIQLNQTYIVNTIDVIQSTVLGIEVSLADMNNTLVSTFGLATEINLTLNEFYAAAQGNWTQILTEISNVESTLLAVNSSLSQQIDGLLPYLTDDVIFSDSGQNADVTTNWGNFSGWNGYWNVSYTGAGEFGFDPRTNPATFGGNTLALGADYVFGDSAYVNLTDAYWASLTQEQKYNDVTFEFDIWMDYALYPDDGWQPYFSLSDWSLSDIIQLAWGNFSYAPGNGMAVTVSGGGAFGSDQYLQSTFQEDDRWYNLQWHVHDWDTTAGTATADLYVDDELLISISDIDQSVFSGFTLYGGGGGNYVYLDNFKIYEGSPKSNGYRLATIDEKVAATQVFLNAMNTTMVARFDALDSFLSDMNASLNLKLDSVLSNVTYTQLYMETTLTPLVNSTYQNTLAILAQLGIIEGQLNTTIAIVNNTNQIVNETATDVDELVNRSRRIRAWVTQ